MAPGLEDRVEPMKSSLLLRLAERYLTDSHQAKPTRCVSVSCGQPSTESGPAAARTRDCQRQCRFAAGGPGHGGRGGTAAISANHHGLGLVASGRIESTSLARVEARSPSDLARANGPT